MRTFRRLAVLMATSALVATFAVLGSQPGASSASAGHISRTGPVDGRLVFIDFSQHVMYTVNPDGTALVQVTQPDPNVHLQDPVWTPDGLSIVYAASVNGADYRLYEMQANGTGNHLLFDDKPGYGIYSARVTPDGKRVVFERCRPDPPGGCALFVSRLDGTHRRTVVPYHSSRKDYGPSGSFAISPNGRRIAYTEIDRSGIIAQIWVSRLDGAHAHPVSRPADELACSAWLDDRTLLVNGPDNHFGAGIYRLALKGRRLTRLYRPRSPADAYAAGVSPSGRHIPFVSDKDFADLSGLRLYLMRPNGTHRHLVDLGIDTVGGVDWGTAPLMP